MVVRVVCLGCVDCRAIFGFFFQAEDGIRDAQESRGLGDVYKRQARSTLAKAVAARDEAAKKYDAAQLPKDDPKNAVDLSLIHI